MLLEAIPASVAAHITDELSIPTIGIGAGPGCDGQVQVWHDILGIAPGKSYKHVKRYAEIGELIETAIRTYADEVLDRCISNKGEQPLVMRTFQQVGPLRAYLRGIRAEGRSVAFVPTMGALHQGHISLFRRAKSDCDRVVASVFRQSQTVRTK